MKYFDFNATTPLTNVAREAWLDAYDEFWHNASSSYSSGVRVKAKLKRVRQELAELLNIDPKLILFCSGATEACNIWVRSYLDHPFFQKRKLLVSVQEHACLRKSCESYGKDRIKWFSPLDENLIQVLEEQILSSEDPAGGVVMMAANNETGIVNNWMEVSLLCQKHGIPFFCDTCQLVGKVSIQNINHLDFCCGSAHKFGGPKGIGFLKLSAKFPFVRGAIGGGQEEGLRGGTEDYPSINAMVKSLRFLEPLFNDQNQIDLRKELRDLFISGLKDKLPDVIVHNEGHESLWNVVSVALPGFSATEWLEALDSKGFQVSAGSACSTASLDVSRVLKDMQIEDSVAKRTLRISSGWDTISDDWDSLLKAMISIWNEKNNPDNDGLTEVISIDSL